MHLFKKYKWELINEFKVLFLILFILNPLEKRNRKSGILSWKEKSLLNKYSSIRLLSFIFSKISKSKHIFLLIEKLEYNVG